MTDFLPSPSASPCASHSASQRQFTARELAAADFTKLAGLFAGTGLTADLPGPGMLRLCPPGVGAGRLLVSVGVHGNETAPIDMLVPVLCALADAPGMLALDVLVVVGNPAAIAQGTRFVEADLNRLFDGERGALSGTAEAARADQIMHATAAFFADGHGQAWHLDLHSAIRPSRYQRFAIIPGGTDDPAQEPLIRWLGSAAIEAVLFNDQRAPTYSAYTARELGIPSCTVELGQVSALGENAPHRLLRTQEALQNLLRGALPGGKESLPTHFRVVREIIRRSDDFCLQVGSAVHNFTALAPGTVIAVDRDVTVRVGSETEYVVFPNPEVLIGQRAALMVVEVP